MELSATKRITEFDIAKGIGILLVVLGHCLPTDNYWRIFIYSFHMPLFFFLSGAVLKISDEKDMKGIVIGEKNLIANYIFYSGLFLLFDIFAKILNFKQISIKDLFWDVYQTVTLYGINVLWFLSALIIGKILIKIV